jgi:uncharacterized protein YeaC (DUF1315 family)
MKMVVKAYLELTARLEIEIQKWHNSLEASYEKREELLTAVLLIESFESIEPIYY